jgi:hypothetical protein
MLHGLPYGVILEVKTAVTAIAQEECRGKGQPSIIRGLHAGRTVKHKWANPFSPLANR